MATIELRTANQQAASASTGWPSLAGNVTEIYAVSYPLDLAAALAAKGSALAASDVVNLGTLPAGTVLLGGVSQVTLASDATTITYNIGFNGGSSAVSGQDGKTLGFAGAALSSTGANVTTATQPVTVTFATLTGTATVGKANITLFVANISQRFDKPGLAQLKS